MTTCQEEALSAIKTLVVNGGSSISEEDLSILEKKTSETGQYSKRIGEINDALYNGFFHSAAKGLVLVPEKRVTERFGNSLEENYPEANEVFLKFAKTYWTLKEVVFDIMENDVDWIGAHLLGVLEQYIGPVFFPFPGPAKIAPSKREKTQRQFIELSGADIDIEEFIKGNPILIRDRTSRSGCSGKGFFSNLFGISEEKIKGACVSIYEKAKSARPDKTERDYLKIVLLTKPPFDYQHDSVIEGIIDEYATNIEELSEYIVSFGNDKQLWQLRKANLKHLRGIKERNIKFFKEFWAT